MLPEQTSNPKTYQFEFTGNGFEYFKIWIVNIGLTIITLGIYSAWAKVRTNRYFYGNTQLAGAAFEYLASPITILKGRLIAFAIFAVYSLASSFFPLAAVPILIIIILLAPIIITKALAFRAINSAYRNLRFKFDKNFQHAYIVLFGIPIVLFIIFSLLVWLISLGNVFAIIAGILMFIIVFCATPFFRYHIAKFIISNSNYGKAKFQFNIELEDYFIIYIKAIIVGLAGFFVLIALIGIIAALGLLGDLPNFDSQEDITNQLTSVAWMPFIVAILTMLAYALPLVYIQVRQANIQYNTTTLGEGNNFSFTCKQELFDMLLIYVTNTLFIALTLGLYIPWAKVRLAKYRASRLQLNAQQDLESFIAHEEASTNALGEEMGEVFDLDVGL